MSGDPVTRLAVFLTGQEATNLAAQFDVGKPMFQAIKEIAPDRRDKVKKLLASADVHGDDPARALAILRAIAGAKSVTPSITPVWTMPGNAAQVGNLNAEFYRHVAQARTAVTCATYNFSPGSKMWEALATARESGAVLTIYVDRDKSSADALKQYFPGAAVYRSAQTPDGHDVVSHAKFVIIDHRVVLVGSANFSVSAEQHNVELGLRVDNPELAASIEQAMTDQRGTIYTLID